MRALCLLLATLLAFGTPARAGFSPGPAPIAVGAISGLTLSNDTTTPAAFIAVAPGGATSTIGGTAPLTLTSSLRKQVTAAWSAGTGGGALDTGTIAASTWYHVFLIGNPASGAVDGLASTSATAPTLPSGWVLARRIGAVRTDGSGNLLAFKQAGSVFIWAASVTDLNGSLSTTASLFPVTFPTGVQVEAIFRAGATSSSQNGLVITPPDAADEAPSYPNYSLSWAANAVASGEFHVRTDNSGRIRARSSSLGTSFGIQTSGWIDQRN
jgi:hypothetical protein